MKKICAFCLILTMLMSIGFLSAASADVDRSPQIVIAVRQNSDQGDADQIWFWKYAQEVLGYNFEIIQVSDTSMAEYKAVTFASGDLPDIFLNLSIDTTEQMTYGVSEHMLLPIDEYISEELTPNMYAYFSENPENLAAITAPDGHVYSVGQFCDTSDEAKMVVYSNRMYYNNRWLQELSAELPKTLDEFVDLLRLAKAARPDCVPLAGEWSGYSPLAYILCAYGFVTSDGKGQSAALRNGEVLFPYADREVYGEYLKTLNTMYTEGLIDKDIFTIDRTTLGAKISNDETFTSSVPPYTYNAATFDEWLALLPITSDYNDVPLVYQGDNNVTTGVYSISADTENPEVCMDFLDWWFDESNALIACFGPNENDDFKLDMTCGWYYDPETTLWGYADVDTGGLYSNSSTYRKQCISPLTSVALGAITAGARFQLWGAAMYLGLPYDRENLVFNIAEPDHFMRVQYRQLLDYMVPGFPSKVFFTVEDNVAISDYQSVINDYVTAETAKFITGQRELTDSELEKYFNELDAMGYQDYLQYFVNYYENLKK